MNVSPTRILVVDIPADTPAMAALSRQNQWECEFSVTIGDALERLAGGNFQLLIIDVGGEPGLALALIALVAADHPDTAVLLITDESDLAVAEEAFALGAQGYLLKPVRSPQLLIATISALRRRDLEIASRNHGQGEEIRLRDELAVSQRQSIEDLRQSRQETVERLTRAIDRHDPSTGKHVARMGAIVGLLATLLDLDPAETALLCAAAPMHDVGKIATPDEILLKPGALNEEERAEMQQHTLLGNEILAGSSGDLLQLAASIALTHHECYDGSGYPHGLAGDEIPLGGRIAAVADVFDALLADRVYRPAVSVAEAVRLMEAGRMTRFDPQIVDLLLDHLDEALDVRLAVAAD